MRNIALSIVVLFLLILITACGGAPSPEPTIARTTVPTTTPLPTATKSPTSTPVVVTVEVTRPYVEIVFTPVYDSPLGEAYFAESDNFELEAGQVVERVFILVNRTAAQYNFAGYICGTNQDQHGFGLVQGGSGGARPDTVYTFDLKIWDDTPPGKCEGYIEVWLTDNDDNRHVLRVPITVTVK